MSHLYVCHFSNGHIKVGRSIKPVDRIAVHVERVACMGVVLVESAIFKCTRPAAECEQALIDYCEEKASKRFQLEWFEGLDFPSVAEVAEQIATGKPASDCADGWKAYLLQIIGYGYTQRRLAQLIGCSQPSIANILNGRTEALSFRVGYGLLQIGRAAGIKDPAGVFPIAESKDAPAIPIKTAA